MNFFELTYVLDIGTKYFRSQCAGVRLSAPFQGNVRPGQLFTPHRAARQITEVIEQLTPEDSGGFFAWDGSRIEY